MQPQKIEGGFRLKRHPDAKAIPRMITLEVAYDVRQGNPFKRYQPFDFELNRSPIKITGKGVEVSILKSNTLRVSIKEVDFRISVTGFDPHRDLKIKIVPGVETAL